MRKRIVAGNWKMNKTYQEGHDLLNELLSNEKFNVSNEVVKILAPSFIHLPSFVEKIRESKKQNIFVAAQNCHQENNGAFTGEVSVEMLSSVGVSYVIIGHSERRQYFFENNFLLSKKVEMALSQALIPIFCIGENLEERKAGIYFDIIKNQLEEALFHLHTKEFSKIIIAYEPVWAIGTGMTATPEQAQEIHHYIRGLISEKFGENVAMNCSILYGGSCNAKNAKELFACEDIDGGLIGGASLKSEDFIKIIHSFS